MTVPGAFRAAVEAKDLAAIGRTLDPAIEFHSPVMVKPYRGKEAVTTLLRVLLRTFEDFRYTHELTGHALSSTAPTDNDPTGTGPPRRWSSAPGSWARPSRESI